MRIHLNHPTPETLLFEARQLAGVRHDRCERHGSRSHSAAFDIILEGESGRRTNQRWGFDNGYSTEAATWDQWGIYLGYIFENDPTAKTPYYADAEDFHRITGNRFNRSLHDIERPNDALVLSQSSPDYKITAHRWDYNPARGSLTCKGHSTPRNMRAECHATMRWS